MPRIGNDLDAIKTPNGYTFSGVNADELKATEYTITSIIQDKSGSVDGFAKEMQNCHKEILGACQKSPRASNLMLRVSTFNSRIDEFFGFRMLSDIQADEFDNMLIGNCGGCTALYDSAHTAIDATLAYGEELTKKGITCNAIIFIITDGDDNASKYTPNKVKELLKKAKGNESVESVLVILVGVNTSDKSMAARLDQFHQDAGLDQFVDIGDATPQKLAKLAQFVSRSVSSQSKSLGSGSGSVLLSF